TMLTPEFQAEFFACVKRCAFLKTACVLAGVDPRTVQRWVARGEREGSGPHTDFCRSLKKALAEAEADALEFIAAGGKKHGQATAWLLERRHPEHWSKRGRQIRVLRRRIQDLWRQVRRLPAA